jgi:hypothetical protein
MGYPETVLPLRLIDPQSGPVVKNRRSDDGKPSV